MKNIVIDNYLKALKNSQKQAELEGMCLWQEGNCTGQDPHLDRFFPEAFPSYMQVS